MKITFKNKSEKQKYLYFMEEIEKNARKKWPITGGYIRPPPSAEAFDALRDRVAELEQRIKELEKK